MDYRDLMCSYRHTNFYERDKDDVVQYFDDFEKEMKMDNEIEVE